MASMCMTQTSYRQLQPEHPYKLLNDNFLLLQKAQQLQTIHSNVYQTKKQQTISPATKVLGNSNLHNIQVGPAGGGSRRDGGGGGGTLVPRRKYNYMNVPYGEQLPSVARRNARERNRVKQVNNGFANLRQHLPQTVINTLSHGGRGANKKLSKVDTLRIAVEYIRGLQDMLEASQPAESKSHVANTLCDESSNDGSHYGYSSMGSPSDLAFNQLQQCYNSEVSASPLSSNSDDSDISIGGTNYLQSVKLEQQQSAKEDRHVVQFDNITHFLTEDQSFGDDDSLLECISSWQEH